MIQDKIKNKFIHSFFKFAARSFTEGSNTLGEFLDTLDSIGPKHMGSLYRSPVDTYSSGRKGLHNLKNRGLIKFEEKGFKLTGKGKTWFRSSYLKYLKDFYPKWDKKWRVIIFDIPQKLHKNRNRFRQRIKSLGFFVLQKSVFVFPYPCEEELAQICRKMKISDYVDVIIADSVGFREEEIKKVFNLS